MNATVALIEQIINGEYDDDLADITAAVERRERMLSPSDAIQVLAMIYANVEKFATAPSDQRSQAGVELNHRLKQLADDPNPHVQALVIAARTEVLIKLLGVPRSTATQFDQIDAAASQIAGDAPDCSQCGASNAGSREAPHLCETCQKLPQATT